MTAPYEAMGRTCWCHRHRHDVPLERHHVWPLGHSGPDAKPNIVVVCANGHGSVHSLLDRMLKAQTASLPWTVRRRYGRRVRRLAVAGYEAIVTQSIVVP